MEGDHRFQPRDLQIWKLTLLRFTLQMNLQNTQHGSTMLPPCSGSINSIWAWIILDFNTKNTNPILKIKWWIKSNRSSEVRRNGQWTTTSKLVTSLSWNDGGFYLAEKASNADSDVVAKLRWRWFNGGSRSV